MAAAAQRMECMATISVAFARPASLALTAPFRLSFGIHHQYYFYYPCFSSTLYAKMPLVGPINAAHHWKTATAAFATPASRALTVDFGKHLEKTMTGKLQPNMTVVFVSLTDFANNFTPISFPRKRQSH